jgi:plasmid stabilization system protein ParE
MTYRLSARPEVTADILKVVDWYERQQPGLGAEFADELRRSVRSLRINPLLYQIRHTRHRVRWVLVRRFPYRIVFVVDGDLITVLAVTHAKQHERHWKGRV